MNKNIKKHAHKVIMGNYLEVIITLFIFISLLYFGLEVKFNWGIIISILFSFSVGLLTNNIRKIVINRLEDSAKLDCDYNSLVNRYKNFTKLKYNNRNANSLSKRKYNKYFKNNNTIVEFPIIKEDFEDGMEIKVIDNPLKKYVLPELIKQRFDELFLAHSSSNVYNQLNIRIDNWYRDKNTFFIESSRTTYYDSLVTNRAIDYKWSNNLTTREMFEYGPLLSSLSNSMLSNHLGFKGFIETSDNFLVLVKRSRKLSIDKRTYGTSVNASLKAMYALNNSGILEDSGLKKAIVNEIYDELRINEDELEILENNKNIISMYRDIVEGGKPQLLFYMKSKLSKAEIENNFKARIKGKKSRKINILDGKKLSWIHIDSLSKLIITCDRIILDNKQYKMTPATSSSFVMLIEYLSNHSE